MAKFKTPAVYAEEISNALYIKKIPVTAVFIGYTEKHENLKEENLCRIPTKVHSIQEFETYFGFAQKEEYLKIVDESTSVLEKISVGFNGSPSLHNLYYSIQSFFDQGEGSCEIISLGTYKNIGEYLEVEDFLRGLEVLNNSTKNILVAVPEHQNLADGDFDILQQNLLEYCKRNFGFCVLDLPKTTAENYLEKIENYRNSLQSDSLSYGATFFPDLVTANAYFYEDTAVKITKDSLEFYLDSIKESDFSLYTNYQNMLKQFYLWLPPSSAVMGAFLKNDQTRGIWKAAANIVLKNIIKPEIIITNEEQDLLNVDPVAGKSINAIRKFFGKGTLIWGGRTLSGNDSEWRYISTRRFVNTIQKDIQEYLNQIDAEDNSTEICTNISRVVENYLNTYFREGAFQGTTAKDSYFVHCGLGETMLASDIRAGIIIVEIGLAVIRPQEFIIVRFSREVV